MPSRRTDGDSASRSPGTTSAIPPARSPASCVSSPTVTWRKQVEEQLRAARGAAEAASQAKTKFLAVASHDIRQPLQALNLFVNALSERDLDPASHRIVEKIRNSVEALQSLLNTLLDISKLDAGLVIPRCEVFALRPLVTKLSEEFAPLATHKGLAFECSAADVRVRSDPALVAIILRNLLSNALRYTEQGRIAVTATRNDGTVCLTVRDTGIGIPESQLEEIFEDFHQVRRSQRDQRMGLGLGLGIVRRVARMLDHPVRVVSVIEKGSAFTFELPTDSTEAAPEAGVDPTDHAIASGRLIALFEDDIDVMDAMSVTLEAWGFEVVPVRITSRRRILEASCGLPSSPGRGHCRLPLG